MTTYLRDTNHLLYHIKDKDQNKELVNKVWFSFDTVSFYTNIKPHKDLERFRLIFTNDNFTMPKDNPTEKLLAALELIMRTNIFKFGKTFWR